MNGKRGALDREESLVIGQKSRERTKERAMSTLNQLIRHGRKEKRLTDRTRAWK